MEIKEISKKDFLKANFEDYFLVKIGSAIKNEKLVKSFEVLAMNDEVNELDGISYTKWRPDFCNDEIFEGLTFKDFLGFVPGCHCGDMYFELPEEKPENAIFDYGNISKIYEVSKEDLVIEFFNLLETTGEDDCYLIAY